MTEITSDLVAQAIQSDDELVSAARKLAYLAIEVATRHLIYGAPATQLTIIRALMPAVGRSLADQGESEDLADMRRELQALNQKLLSA